MDTPTPDDIASDVQQRSDTQLKRGLASRHMQMIAIGGAIGTGLFLASGATVANAGPGGALLAYAAIGLMVLLLMQSLGEMSAHQPVAGSFQTFATKFISPSFGFAMGWNYWFNWAVTAAAAPMPMRAKTSVKGDCATASVLSSAALSRLGSVYGSSVPMTAIAPM